jgi:glycosyltransferase involved in cell wall biosynthesis
MLTIYTHFKQSLAWFIAKLPGKKGSSIPKVFHNPGSNKIGGPSVKLVRMNHFFPNEDKNYNIIYSISNRIPADLCRKAKNRGVKVVSHINSIYIPSYRINFEDLNKPVQAVYNLADYVVFGSYFAKSATEKFWGKTKAPSSIIYNAVDIESFHPIRTSPKDQFNILAIGSHYIRHRIEPIIRAMPYIYKKYPNALLIIAGPLKEGEGIFDCGPDTIQKIINDVGGVNVKFIGKYSQEEAPLLYSQGDVLVHTKDMDWTPNTVIEGMACGLPIVHTGNGGLNEIVQNAGVSLELPFDWDNIHVADPMILASRIIEAYEERTNLGKLAREIAVEKYDIRKWAEEHKKIFQDLLNT